MLTSNFLLHTGYLFNTLQEGNIGLIFPFIVIQTSLLQHSNDDYDFLLGFLNELAQRKFLSILYTGPLRKTLYYCCYMFAGIELRMLVQSISNIEFVSKALNIFCSRTDMQTDILNLERTIARLRKEVFRWLEYKDIGSKERAKQIELLEKELHDMKQSYDEMSGTVHYF